MSDCLMWQFHLIDIIRDVIFDKKLPKNIFPYTKKKKKVNV